MKEPITVCDLLDEYRSQFSEVSYEPCVSWFQPWRYHRVFSESYQESRALDTFLHGRLLDVMRAEMDDA